MYILYINIYVVWPNTQEKNSSSVKQKNIQTEALKTVKVRRTTSKETNDSNIFGLTRLPLMSPCFFDVKVVPPNKKNKTTIKPIDSLVLKILHWFILKYFKMCSLNQIIKSSVPASLLLAILSSSVSTSWTPPKKVWRSMWCSNDSTDHLGFMWIYVDLCNLFGVVFREFMPFMVIFSGFVCQQIY